MGPRRVLLSALQPSQLYVSRTKLEAVAAGCSDPVPVRRYGDRLVLTDGHSRALAAHRAGLDAVLVIVDEDDLDDEAYEICVGWCLDAGIRSVLDLEERVVEPEAFKRLWLERCRRMHRDLAVRRRATPRPPEPS